MKTDSRKNWSDAITMQVYDFIINNDIKNSFKIKNPHSLSSGLPNTKCVFNGINYCYSG